MGVQLVPQHDFMCLRINDNACVAFVLALLRARPIGARSCVTAASNFVRISVEHNVVEAMGGVLDEGQRNE